MVLALMKFQPQRMIDILLVKVKSLVAFGVLHILKIPKVYFAIEAEYFHEIGEVYVQTRICPFQGYDTIVKKCKPVQHLILFRNAQ
jgi:hypothetical protein